jgi:glycosyltransferase involved in cell wall biosynthesis
MTDLIEPVTGTSDLISVIIPARDVADTIGGLVREILAQSPPSREVEVIVVDDGSRDETVDAAVAAGARVVRLEGPGGNPAVARNRGVQAARGDLLVFIDADCHPAPGWLERLLAGHETGAEVVGGSLELPTGLSPMARCDYYCGCYHVHARRERGEVPNHPPGNISVRRDVFAGTGGWTEQQPAAYAHEELAWQAEVLRSGGRILFEPNAVVHHFNRPGFLNLLRRNYRWGFSAIETKAQTEAARQAWVYRHPVLLVAASLPLALASTAYVVGCWARARVLEPLLMLPVILAARLAYSAGLAAGGIRWIRFGAAAPEVRARWE